MSFLIPVARPNPSGPARLGRLLHWAVGSKAALAEADKAMASNTPKRRRS